MKISEAFNCCDLSFSFEINGLQISKKYINIYEKRGKDTGIQLRLNKEIDSIITTKSIANLATALKCKGGTPDDSEEPITLLGYEYDDGDFYVEGSVLKSRNALANWSRYLGTNDETQQSGGHIVKQYSDDSLSQAVLCENAIAELKTICDMKVNYEVDISEFPENVKIGDRVNIIDDEGGLYLSSRVLILETSVADRTRRAVLGEHLIRKDGISETVEKMAAQFSKNAATAAKAIAAAKKAEEQADSAVQSATEAHEAAERAENTEVGCRNLYGFEKDVAYDGEFTVIRENNGFNLEVTNTSGYTWRIYNLGFGSPGNYTFSANVYASADNITFGMTICGAGNTTFTVGTTKQKIWFTANTEENVTPDTLSGYVEILGASWAVGTIVYFEDVK